MTPAADDSIEVLLADDHPLVRNGLQAMLESSEGVSVVGQAANGWKPSPLRWNSSRTWLSWTSTCPSSTAPGDHAPQPGVAVLVLSMLDADDSVVAALRAGARGYLLKDSGPDAVLRAIRAVARGEAIFGAEIAGRMLASFSTPPSAPPTAFPELTQREREVLDLLATGSRSAEIAQRLGLRPKTVRNHVSNILTKLAALDRTGAILRAREAGLGQS